LFKFFRAFSNNKCNLTHEQEELLIEVYRRANTAVEAMMRTCKTWQNSEYVSGLQHIEKVLERRKAKVLAGEKLVFL
jgi:hypothetical protein